MRPLPSLLALGLAALVTSAAFAAPFDMSAEKPAGSVAEPFVKTAPDPATVTVPKTAPALPQNLRYLIPSQKLTLDGEIAGKTWTIYLTPGQVAAARKLNYGYRNSIVVAPETSKLSVYVNDTLIAAEPVQSPNTVSERSYDLPADLLKAGANTISFRAIHQHRTDCTIASTYELWSEIIPASTFLTMDPKVEQAIGSVEDVKAVGVDKQGRTHFRIVAPKREHASHIDAVMRLTQGLALVGRMPNQSFEIASSLGLPAGPGEMTVLIGPAADLAPILPNLPQTAGSSGFVGFVEASHPGTGQPGNAVLVVSGPTWQAVSATVDTMVAPLARPDDVQRDALWTQAWTGSDTPFVQSSTSLTFSQLGLLTTEFGGRRFRSGFDIGVPADFYANAYGEATILLDAAYSADILPGSHIDVYVNGNIASTVPITSTAGGIYRHLPIRVTMRHFRPGANHIEIEAMLTAKADVACVPGAPANSEPRFALFDTSEFRMPDFARIAQLPSLAAVAGTGFPYSGAPSPISLFMDRMDDQTLSTAATLLGKLALAAGKPVPTVAETSTARIGDSNAIFVGAISQIPPVALRQVYLADASRTAWGNRTAKVTSERDNKIAFDDWKTRVQGGALQGRFTALGVWLKQTFDISLASLQFLPAEETDTMPPNAASFLAAQGVSPDRSGTWTVVAAPNGQQLQQGMAFLADEDNWRRISGRLFLLDTAKKDMTTVAAQQSYLVETQPMSLFNYRLIAANWLSTNILSYALLFAGASVMLGIATSGLLNTFGRSK